MYIYIYIYMTLSYISTICVLETTYLGRNVYVNDRANVLQVVPEFFAFYASSQLRAT